MLYHLVCFILHGIFLLTNNFKSFDTGNIPRKGGALIVSNHRSNGDPMALGSASHKRIFHFVAKRELFRNPVFGFLLRCVGTFPVDREKTDLKMIRKAIQMLKKGKVILLFAEGTRNQDPAIDLLPLKEGFAYIASRAKVPIIPTCLIGTNHLFQLRFPRKKVFVYFGPPIDSDQPLEKIAQETQEAILGLYQKGRAAV